MKVQIYGKSFCVYALEELILSKCLYYSSWFCFVSSMKCPARGLTPGTRCYSFPSRFFVSWALKYQPDRSSWTAWFQKRSLVITEFTNKCFICILMFDYLKDIFTHRSIHGVQWHRLTKEPAPVLTRIPCIYLFNSIFYNHILCIIPIRSSDRV